MDILIVDDEKDTPLLFQQAFKNEIKEQILHFYYVSSAEEALTLLNYHPNISIALILSNINMPGLTGIELLKILQTRYAHIYTTIALEQDQDTELAKEYGAKEFINRSTNLASLKNWLLKLISSYKYDLMRTEGTVKILVVDDESDVELLMRQRFSKYIKNQVLDFMFASNGVEALKILKEHTEIHIVITDLNMPEMDGLTLLSHLSEFKRIFKTIIISAYGDMPNIRKAMNLGASDFITKPIDFKDLEITIFNTIQHLITFKKGVEAQNRLSDIQKELAISSHIQASLLPQQFQPFEGSKTFEILGKMIPAKSVGGDFFDFFPLDSQRLGFLIGDVSGKGIPAALLMVMTQAILRATAQRAASPQECLTEANLTLGGEISSSMFVTIFYGILDINSGQVTASSAGHVPPFILRADHSVEELAIQGNFPLGVLADATYSNVSFQLNPGDQLILYTDGIPEAMDHDHHFYTYERFRESLKKYSGHSLEELIKHILADVDQFVGKTAYSDDISLLCIKQLAHKN